MKKVIFLGSKQIGYECLKYLLDQQAQLDFQIVGVLTNPRGEAIRQLCADRAVPVIPDLAALLKHEVVDLAISVQYHAILKPVHIARAQLAVNLHMAPLPEYRGCNQFTFAILDRARVFGTTLHRLEASIDGGDIIAERRWPVDPDIWVDELYEQTFRESLLLLAEAWSSIVAGTFTLTPQAKLLKARGTNFHLRQDIQAVKQVSLSWSQAKIERTIRATAMPGFEPPYAMIANKKVYLVRHDDEKNHSHF